MAKITIEYDKAILANGYFMKTMVKPFPDTEPAGDLEECLVIQEASYTQDERILRVAEPTELVEFAVADPLVFFRSSEIGALTVPAGYTLRLPMQPEWVHLGYVGDYIDFEITGQVGEIIQVATAIPSFYRGDFLLFSVYPVPPLMAPWYAGTIGYALRNDAGAAETLRIDEHVDMFSDIVTGANKQTILGAQAQALVDATNVDEESFSGTDTEVYE